MDEQPPKPSRDWRSFGKEYVIVVLGVATALAAQQAADWLHWRSEVTIARKALRDEITTTNRFLVRRIAVHACRERQEREARAILDSLDGKFDAPPFTTFHHSAGVPVYDAEWQSERSAQVLTHFPRDELALMSSHYSALPHIDTWTNDEGTVWAALSVLQTSPLRLAPSDVARLRGELDHAHRLNYIIVLTSDRLLKLSDQLGIARPPPDLGYVDAFCKTSDDQMEAENLKAIMTP